MRDVKLITERWIPEFVGDLQHSDGQGRGPHGADQHQLWKIEAIESSLCLSKSVQNAQPKEQQGEEKGGLK